MKKLLTLLALMAATLAIPATSSLCCSAAAANKPGTFTTGDKTFLPTRCGFVWETQSTNAQGIEIRHVKSLGETTGIETLDMNGSKADVYDVNGRIVKSKAGSLDGLPHGIYVVGGKKIIK